MKHSCLLFLRNLFIFILGASFLYALAPLPLSAAPGVVPWSALDSGLNNDVSEIVVSGSDMYMGGAFTQVCGDAACDSSKLSVNHVAKWDGSHWLALDNGLGGGDNGGMVTALALRGNDLYAGGYFTQICGNATCDSNNKPVNHLAKWDGTQWSAVGNGVGGGWYTGFVGAMAVSGNDVYIGGWFTDVCGNAACDSDNLTVNHIVKWDGSNWSALDNGLGTGVYGFGVDALAVNGSDVYAGGFFSAICGNSDCNTDNIAVNHIAKWDGTQWSALNNGVNGLVYTVAMSGNDLLVGGEFDALCGNADCTTGNTPAFHIAKWDSSNWSVLGNGVRTNVQALAVDGANVYAGGVLDAICGNAACNTNNLIANRLAKWDGSQWSALGSGVNDVVSALAVKDGKLYVGGIFPLVCGDMNCAIGNLKVNHIAVTYTSMPAQPTLNIPANKATVGKRPRLVWNTALNATTYKIFIKNAATGKLVLKKVGLTAPHFRPKRDDALTSNVTYKWYVQACNPLGCTQSETRRFTVQPSP